MNAPKDTNSTVLPIEGNANSLRWEGHMSDGAGSTFGAEPCAVLLVNADEIWLKGNRGDFHIPRKAVVRVGRGPMYPWFFRGIRIRHNIEKFPAYLQFRPMVGGIHEILTQLKALGFPIS
jgi:hypothetical protein